MKKLLGIIAVGAIAFGAVTTAATSLSGLNATAPAQGTLSISGLGCVSTDDATLAYGTDNTSVTSITQTVTCSTAPGSWAANSSDSFTGLGASYGSGQVTVSFNAVPVADFGESNYDSIAVTALP